MQIDINELRRKIIRKNGQGASLIKLSVIAKVLGYSSTEPVADIADKIGIQVFKLRKYRVIKQDDLQRLLNEMIKSL